MTTSMQFLLSLHRCVSLFLGLSHSPFAFCDLPIIRISHLPLFVSETYRFEPSSHLVLYRPVASSCRLIVRSIVSLPPYIFPSSSHCFVLSLRLSPCRPIDSNLRVFVLCHRIDTGALWYIILWYFQFLYDIISIKHMYGRKTIIQIKPLSSVAVMKPASIKISVMR